MTKDEALKLALEYLKLQKMYGPAMGFGNTTIDDALNTIKEALDECDEDELIIRYHEMTIKRLEKLLAQPEQEPVGSVVRWVDGSLIHGWFGDPPPEGTLLYITPPVPVQPEQEPVARVIDNGTPEGATEWIPFANRVEPLKTGDLLYTHAEERNFCPRCGKRTADLTTIHTCTPPQENT